MADLVRYELEDGSTVYFESAEGSLVSLRGGEPGLWLFSRVSGEGSISVTLTWKNPPSP
jgi:hypothetical protein